MQNFISDIKEYRLTSEKQPPTTSTWLLGAHPGQAYNHDPTGCLSWISLIKTWILHLLLQTPYTGFHSILHRVHIFASRWNMDFSIPLLFLS